MPNKHTFKKQYQLSLEELRARLAESEEALRAIRSGEVDAIVVPGQSGELVFTLKGADQTFRVLIEVMNEGAMMLTAEGIIIYANRRLGEIFKSSIEKITGSSIREWIAAESEITLQDLLRSDNTQIRRRGEVTLLASDGTLMPGFLSLNMLQVEDMQGFFCMVATNLTEQKNIDSIKAAEGLAQKLLAASEQSRLVLLSMIEDQQRVSDALKESELRYRTLADSGQALIWTSGRDKKCDYFNKPWLTFTGRTVEQEFGDGWIEGVHQDDLARCITTYTTAFDALEPFSIEYRLRRNDGEYRWILDDGMPRYDTKGNFIGYIGHCLDITERKQAEEELKTTNQQLSERVKEMSCLNGVSKIVEIPGISLEEIFLKTIELIPASLQYPEITVCRIILDGKEYKTPEFKKTRWKLCSTIMFDGNHAGDIEVYYLEKKPDIDEGPFLKEERMLLDMIAERLGMFNSRRQAEKKLKKSEVKFRSYVDSAPDGIFITDENGKYVDVNPAASTITGYSKKELLNLSIPDLLQPDFIETGLKGFQDLSRNGLLDVDLGFVTKSSENRFWRVSAIKLSNQRFLGFTKDITEYKLAEEELAKLNRELEQRVIERTADMEKANRELESFSYTVSHDLRAPLRHINGFITMFRNEVGESMNEKARHYMDVISESADRMGQLIDDLLSFSRMGRTELTIDTVDIGNLSDEVIEGFSEENSEHKIIFSRGAMPLVQGDEAMLRVVLTNLISNAVKFTSRTENRKIEIGCDSKNGENICYVKDNGVGFDMRYVDKLFGVFHRLHNERDFEGTGIGLATIKRIIDQHGGRVWAEGNVDHGAQFYFSLPSGKPGHVGVRSHKRDDTR